MPEAPRLEVAVNARFLLPGRELEGIGRFTYEVMQRVVHAHPEATFHFLFDRPFDDDYVFAANVIPHVLHPPARHPLLWFAWFEGAVALWLARNRPHVFLSLDGYTTLTTTVPRVTVVHDLAFEHFPDDVARLHRAYYRFFSPRFVRASDGVVAVSKATRQDIATTYGVDRGRIDVVPNAVDSRFVPLPASARQGVRDTFTSGAPYFLFVGALQPRKNLVNLLRAYDQFVEDTGSSVRLLLVGRVAWKAGPIMDAYESMSHRDHVDLAGRVPDSDLIGLYGAALATVFVPFFEGFGIPILEAQACGSPVITSDRSSMPEVAGDAAVLVDPTSVEEIRRALTTISQDISRREDLIRRGWLNTARYSWESSAQRLWQILERVSTCPT